MSNVAYLSRPALVSALGAGIAEHMSALLGDKENYLSVRTDLVDGQSFEFGAVNETLREFPNTLDAGFKSRNNQLLWHALSQIETDIQHTIERYGQERIAVVMGTSTTGGDENEVAFLQHAKTGSWQGSDFSQAKQLMSSPADFIAHVYGLKNMVYGISTACTSGARALISAARLLNLGLCDAVICGGVDTLSRLSANGFNALEVLSNKQCQPFTQNRNGINIGEAAAVFIATRENTSNMALLGYGASSDAYHMSSPHPKGDGAKLAITKALQHAHVTANEIAWVNLHGTGTKQNDAMEATAIADVLGQDVSCASSKALTGHTLGAAGALEAAFLWMVMNPQSNCKQLLPKHRAMTGLDTQLAPIHLTQQNEKIQGGRKICGLSTSFAFGGNNTALIIGRHDANTHI